jgi:hypothetical protein
MNLNSVDFQEKASVIIAIDVWSEHRKVSE